MTEEPAASLHTAYSVGASSGGAAALVASGAVPIAHANDGGGSIRIPAAAAGLVGLKPSRGRHLAGEQSRLLPIDIISEGVLTRSVRDTAAFLAATEAFGRNRNCRRSGSSRARPVDGFQSATLLSAILLDSKRPIGVRTAVLDASARILNPIALRTGSRSPTMKSAAGTCRAT